MLYNISKVSFLCRNPFKDWILIKDQIVIKDRIFIIKDWILMKDRILIKGLFLSAVQITDDI